MKGTLLAPALRQAMVAWLLNDSGSGFDARLLAQEPDIRIIYAVDQRYEHGVAQFALDRWCDTCHMLLCGVDHDT